MELKSTLLLDEHTRLGAQLGPFGGWRMPIQYSGIIAEHGWCRSSVCLFDICHMGEFLLKGDALRSGFNAATTVEAAAMPVGACRYGFLLNEHGGILDDLVIYRLKEDEWMVVVNAATTDNDEAQLRARLAAGMTFENISGRIGKLDVQGPRSFETLSLILGERLSGLAYYRCGYFKLLGEQVIVSRTGYTGELGYELYASPETIRSLWTNLLEAKEVKPAGLGARDTLRLELGYVLYGQDIAADTTPLEAGLGGFIELKRDFIGRDALLKSRTEGVRRRLVCFRSLSRRAPRHDHRILKDGVELGVVTSGSFSPSLGCGIGMGYVREELPVGTAVSLSGQGAAIDAVIADKPFYKNGTARMNIMDKLKLRAD